LGRSGNERGGRARRKKRKRIRAKKKIVRKSGGARGRVWQMLLGTSCDATDVKLSVGRGIEFWYRIPFDQSELSISNIPPTDSPKVRPGRDP
jgi:hypothetical protein